VADPERLYTIREVAAQYRVHPDTLRRWLAKGVAPPTRIGPNGPGKRPRIRLTASEAQKLAPEDSP
jgi:excisionase family DNA binding protein